ncbi:MAG: hypothetical protein F6K47_23830 [Symploca sp. SIO2E6]|nr:hypothetical protein [Symploca sp. SIO2E6]
MPANRTTPAGLEYGPTASGKMYLSVYKHRGDGSRRHKNCWSADISPDMEYGIFCSSDDNDWHDEEWNYWGVLDLGRTVLGEKGERICKFPCTSNEQDPWHGYPASPRDKGASDTPPDLLVDRWISKNIVTKEIGRKIQKLRI